MVATLCIPSRNANVVMFSLIFWNLRIRFLPFLIVWSINIVRYWCRVNRGWKDWKRWVTMNLWLEIKIIKYQLIIFRLWMTSRSVLNITSIKMKSRPKLGITLLKRKVNCFQLSFSLQKKYSRIRSNRLARFPDLWYNRIHWIRWNNGFTSTLEFNGTTEYEFEG